MKTNTREAYPSDVTDEEWALVAPYLALVREESPQRRHDLRAVCNGWRWLARAGAPGRMPPHAPPPWEAVCQQTRRGLEAGVFAAIAHDLRMLPREAADRMAQPRAAVLDSRTIQATPTSGARAGYDGHKRRRGTKVHAAVDTRGPLLALVATPADERDRARVTDLARAVQEATDEAVEVAFADQGDTGEQAAAAAAAHGPRLEVVKLPAAKRGFVLLPRRWVVERGVAWAARFRRLARGYARLEETAAGLHCLAVACVPLHRFVKLLAASP